MREKNKRKSGENHTKKGVVKYTPEMVRKATPTEGVVKYTPKKKRRKMNKVELGKRVKAIREHYGLPQPLFAKQINKTPGFISDIETGKSGVSEETISALSRAFGVNKEWLVSGAGEMGCGVAADKAGIGKRIKEIRKESSGQLCN